MEMKYILSEIKNISEIGRFSGYASVFNVIDRHGDIVLKGAFKKSIEKFSQDNPLIVLLEHKDAIGIIDHASEDDYGLYVEGKISTNTTKGLDVYKLMKDKVISKLSIGYRSVNSYYDKEKKARIIPETELFEVSLVSIPANESAKIIETKSNNITGNNIMENNYIKELEERINKIEVKSDRPQVPLPNINLDQDPEHREAFKEYLKKGYDGDLNKIEKKALSVGSDQDGGYLVTRKIKHGIFEKLNDMVSIRKLASVEKISSDALEIIEDKESVESGWTSETGQVKETSTPRISKKIIPVHEIYAQPKATQKLIDDAEIDIESWVEDKISKSFAEHEEYAFIKGDGVAKPRGILSYQDGKEWGKIEQVPSGSTNNISATAIMKMVYSLDTQYASKATFLMNRQTAFLIRNLKNEQNGNYLWNPSMSENGYDTLLGIPVIYSDAMPTPITGNIVIALADFKSAYQIVDRQNIRVMRDPFTEKPFVKFYATKRIGGDIKNFHAIKLMRMDVK